MFKVPTLNLLSMDLQLAQNKEYTYIALLFAQLLGQRLFPLPDDVRVLGIDVLVALGPVQLGPDESAGPFCVLRLLPGQDVLGHGHLGLAAGGQLGLGRTAAPAYAAT